MSAEERADRLMREYATVQRRRFRRAIAGCTRLNRLATVILSRLEDGMAEHVVKLGDKVRDTISGFEGVAVARTEYLNGCARVGVQPPVDKDGKLPEAQHFDQPQLMVLAGKEAARPAHDVDGRTGGPGRYPDRGRNVDPGR